jgi:diguanylate cyclase (GGDEF)-like protein/PAS domain S-box-containing protein
VTILGTLLVVIAEFGLLTAVYERAAPVRNARIVVAALQAELAAPGARSSVEVARDTAAADARLRSLGVSKAELAQPVTKLAATLKSRQHRLDLEAMLSYAALLILASVGWMVWFRRLVARHRALQEEFTAEQSRAVGEQRLAALVRNSADVVIVCGFDAEATFVTASACSILGMDPDSILGTRCLDLVVAQDREVFLRQLSAVGEGEDRPLRVRMHHADGRLLHVEGTVTNLIADPAVKGLVITIRDITARVDLETQLTHQAFHDPLTGLANRQLFSDRLSHALEPRGSQSLPLCVLFCDLDEFKNINDSLGHGVGDEVLNEVGRRATQAVRPGDTVARLGGDEFAILIENAELPEAQDIAQQLLTALADPIVIDGHSINVRASIGIARAVPGELTGIDALRNADVAMYLAKDRGKGTIAVYEARLHSEALERLALRFDLQRAIREDELVLHFQPTIDLSTGDIAGFEALVRWQHPERGLIAPADFIPIAEQTGLIHALGSWVLRSACRAAVGLFEGAPDLYMAVNVASQQLGRADFIDEVFAILAETGLPACQLTLEITESVVLQDVQVISERLATLRKRNIRIAIDDFGTGYSSLAYLRNLPVDVLKVDKAFVDSIVTDRGDAALTEAILAMSESMSLTTVAEGVEDAEQADWLAGARCRYGQGYYWSRPVPIERARGLLEEQGRAAATPKPAAGSLPGPRTPQVPATKV